MLRQIDQYTLVEHISSSEVGDTFRAIDKSASREVLVKVGRRGSAEFRLPPDKDCAAELDGVAQLIEARSTADDELLLVEGWISGQRLDLAASRYEGDWRQVAHVIRELAITLSQVHARGVTHGDISPQSIVIREDGTPALVQLGMGLPVNSLSQTTPEALERKLKHDVRADLFALGCVMYELLAGESPTQAHASRLSDPMAEGDDISPIDATAPEAPPELRAICSQAISTDPVHRYLDAEVLVRDLEAYLYGRRSNSTVKIVFALLVVMTVGLFGIWGTVGGGPARIVEAHLVRYAVGDAVGRQVLGSASSALTADQRFGIDVRLTKAAKVSVFHRLPSGKVEALAVGHQVDGRALCELPVDDAGWSAGGRGGVGVLIVAVKNNSGTHFKGIIDSVFAESGAPPQSLAPVVTYGDYLPTPIEPALLGDDGSLGTGRWKSVTDFVRFVRRRIANQFDDVVIVLFYVVGA